MARTSGKTFKPARSLTLALTIGVAALFVGCAQSESMQWAQTAPTIAPQGMRQPVNMGVATDELPKPDAAARDSSG